MHTVSFMYMASEGCRRITNSFLPCFLPKQWDSLCNKGLQVWETEYVKSNENKITQSQFKRSKAIHLKMSPGTSLNWTRISAFLEFKAFPAFSIKGTPAGKKNGIDQLKEIKNKNCVFNPNKRSSKTNVNIWWWFPYLPIFHCVFAEWQLQKLEYLNYQEPLDHLYSPHIVQEQLLHL